MFSEIQTNFNNICQPQKPPKLHKQEEKTTDESDKKIDQTLKYIEIDGRNLNVQDVVNVSRHYYRVVLSDIGRKQVLEGNKWLLELVSSNKPVYGVNTGFGVFANKNISNENIEELNRNLILSHACALGDPLPNEVVRAALLIRLNSLTLGYSGVRLEVVNTIITMLNENVTPVVHSQGSLASSGDLCLLAEAALVYTNPVRKNDQESGQAWYKGKLYDGKQAMELAKIPRITLQAKEGLAVTNGATFTAALMCLNIVDCINLWKACNVSLALTMEALLCVPGAFDERVHKVRPYEGSQQFAYHIRQLTKKSTFIDAKHRNQDPYSIRCSPQVQGSVYDAIQHCLKQLTIEINSACDNPLIVGSMQSVSGGNFHGEPLGQISDYLKVALCSLANISERRSARIIDGNLSNELPAMLIEKIEDQGLNSGLMIPQYTAATLTLKNRTLATPDTVLSLPTSGNQEDYNANAWNSVLHLKEIVENTYNIVGIEIFLASCGIQIRKKKNDKLMLGTGTGIFYDKINKIIECKIQDYYMRPNMTAIYNFIKSDDFALYYDEETKPEDTNNQKLTLATPQGTRDFHPDNMIVREKIINTIKKIFKCHGAEEIDTPVFEKREILFGKYGDNNKLVYDLEDQGQPLSLRYDLTVPFARYIAQHGRTSMKRFHIAKVYRRDHPSIPQGRYREFYQCDLDYAGFSDIMLADVEILQTFIDALSHVCVMNFVVKINHKKLLTDIMSLCGIAGHMCQTACSSIDKLDKEPWDVVSKELFEKGVDTNSINNIKKYVTIHGEPRKVLKNLNEMFANNEEIKKILNEMEVLFKYLDAFGCINKIEFDLSLARGLDYYTGIIFEAVLIKENSDIRLGSIGAGGRYDNLIGMFSKQNKNIPAVGCSIGIERLFTLMESQSQRTKETQVLVHPIGTNMICEVLAIVKELWDADITAEFTYETNPKMKSQIEYALSCKIPFMVIVGENELKNGEIIIKTMNKNQDKIKRKEVVQCVKKLINNVLNN